MTLTLLRCAGCQTTRNLERTDYGEPVCAYCNYCDHCQEVRPNGELVLKRNGELVCLDCDTGGMMPKCGKIEYKTAQRALDAMRKIPPGPK